MDTRGAQRAAAPLDFADPRMGDRRSRFRWPAFAVKRGNDDRDGSVPIARGRHREAPYEAVLGQMVKIREGGAERHVTAAEAFLLQLRKRALEGDRAAARECLAMIEQARERQRGGHAPISTIRLVGRAPASTTSELDPLRMTNELDIS